MNVLKEHLRITVETLLRSGTKHREIERRTGVNRRTIRALAAKCSGVATGSEPKCSTLATGFSGGGEQNPPPRPPALPKGAASACAPHRAFIEAQVALGRNALAIYQDLVDGHGFTQRYNSVKRFVRVLKAREPERFDVLEFLPGEEAQVDYGQGALTRLPNGKYRRPYLFVMTLKYSGKSFRKVVWKTDQQVWARLHEEAWRSFGGCTAYVVLDNLKEGVIRPDYYEPGLNSVYAALLAHYGVAADVCRVRDPNRKGTVESAIQHTQATALKGRRFESIDEQNAFLAHWEERWAAPRIHGRKKRQVLEMYREERPHLKPLPVEGFRYFREGVRTVDDAGMVQVEGSYYAALPARLYSEVKVRIFDRDIQVLAADGSVLRRHPKSLRKGSFTLEPQDRIFNPSRETLRLLGQLAKVGPHTARLGDALFRRQGRLARKTLHGLSNLPRRFRREDIEAVVEAALAAHCHSYLSIKGALERRAELAAPPPALTQAAPEIRDIREYQDFFDAHTHHQEVAP
ncbi:MAG: IS21 family transposase [Burkholderiales bacterium]